MLKMGKVRWRNYGGDGACGEGSGFCFTPLLFDFEGLADMLYQHRYVARICTNGARQKEAEANFFAHKGAASKK